MPELGTAWCAPGEGATTFDLRVKWLRSTERATRDPAIGNRLTAISRAFPPLMSNLALTGHKLTNQDAERILSERFRVGGVDETA